MLVSGQAEKTKAMAGEKQKMVGLEVESNMSYRTVKSTDPQRTGASFTIPQEECYGSLHPEALGGKSRAEFVRKVDAILGFQLLIPVVTCLGGMVVLPLGDFFASCAYYAGGYGFFVAAIATLCCLQLYRSSHPKNYQLLVIFTMLTSIEISGYCVTHQQGENLLVLSFLLMTMFTLALQSAYAWFADEDFSWTGGLFLISATSACGCVASLFMGLSASVIVPLFGSFVFCACTLYETSRLLHIYGPDESMRAAVEVYLDILNPLSYLVYLCGRSDDE